MNSKNVLLASIAASVAAMPDCYHTASLRRTTVGMRKGRYTVDSPEVKRSTQEHEQRRKRNAAKQERNQ